jgi:hypothetical protein
MSVATATVTVEGEEEVVDVGESENDEEELAVDCEIGGLCLRQLTSFRVVITRISSPRSRRTPTLNPTLITRLYSQSTTDPSSHRSNDNHNRDH